MHQTCEPPEPRFRPGDSVIYTAPDGFREIYTVVNAYPAQFGETFYSVRETLDRLPESALEPYVPEMTFDVTLEPTATNRYNIDDTVTVRGYDGLTFVVTGYKTERYVDPDQDHAAVTYTLKRTDTGAMMFADEVDVERVGGVAEQTNKETQDSEIDALLDEINDYRRLYEMFGDARYKYGELAAYERLQRQINGQ